MVTLQLNLCLLRILEQSSRSSIGLIWYHIIPLIRRVSVFQTGNLARSDRGSYALGLRDQQRGITTNVSISLRPFVHLQSYPASGNVYSNTALTSTRSTRWIYPGPTRVDADLGQHARTHAHTHVRSRARAHTHTHTHIHTQHTHTYVYVCGSLGLLSPTTMNTRFS